MSPMAGAGRVQDTHKRIQCETVILRAKRSGFRLRAETPAKRLKVVRLRVLLVWSFLIGISCLGRGQEGDWVVWRHVDQELKVRDLPSPRAPSRRASAALAIALETVLDDKQVCCGKGSALEDVVLSEGLSLKELSGKVQGKHRLSDGQSIAIRAEYVAQGAITPEVILGALQSQHALLMEWKSRLYVLYGAVFNETLWSSGRRDYAITRLLLLDPRYADQRRETEFKRASDDLGKVQGLLTLSVGRP